MAFYKKNNRNQTQEKWTQTVFSNIADTPTNYTKKYYGLIKIGDRLVPYDYECKFRSDAQAYFEEIARLEGGTLDTLGVYK